MPQDAAILQNRAEHLLFTFFTLCIYPTNGDGFNDAFDIDIVGGVKYELQITNHWRRKSI
jgi:hypothetical protein